MFRNLDHYGRLLRNVGAAFALGFGLAACAGGAIGPQSPSVNNAQPQSVNNAQPQSVNNAQPQRQVLSLEPHRGVEHLQAHAPATGDAADELGGITESSARALILDDSGGHQSVDPLSLHPAAILDEETCDPYNGSCTTWFSRPYEKCWTVNSPPTGSPSGTAIECYSGSATFGIGDGSLASNPTGHRDTSYAGFGCPLEGTANFMTLDQVTATWAAIRFYDMNLDFIESIRAEQYLGQIYNATSGKSAHLFIDDIAVFQEKPIDGTTNNLYLTIIGNDFGVSANGKLLALSGGILAFDPFFNVLFEKGPHPYDNYFLFNEPSGLVPVCSALT